MRNTQNMTSNCGSQPIEPKHTKAMRIPTNIFSIANVTPVPAQQDTPQIHYYTLSKIMCDSLLFCRRFLFENFIFVAGTANS